MAFMLQSPLPNMHQSHWGRTSKFSLKYLLPMSVCVCVAPVLMCACSFCSYTHMHKTFLHNNILMGMLFLQNESSYRRSE